jgi:hypothetical protein
MGFKISLSYSNDIWPFHPQQGEGFHFPDLPTLDGNKAVGYKYRHFPNIRRRLDPCQR